MRRRRDGELVAHHDRGDAPGAPLLADVLALAAPSGAGLNLDLKASGIERPLVELVRAAGLTGEVTCTGGNWAMLAGIHRMEPGIRAGLTMPRRSAPTLGSPAPARLVRLARSRAARPLRRATRLLQPAARQPSARAPPAPGGLRNLGLDGRRALGDRPAAPPRRRRDLLGRPGQPRLGVSAAENEDGPRAIVCTGAVGTAELQLALDYGPTLMHDIVQVPPPTFVQWIVPGSTRDSAHSTFGRPGADRPRCYRLRPGGRCYRLRPGFRCCRLRPGHRCCRAGPGRRVRDGSRAGGAERPCGPRCPAGQRRWRPRPCCRWGPGCPGYRAGPGRPGPTTVEARPFGADRAYAGRAGRRRQRPGRWGRWGPAGRWGRAGRRRWTPGRWDRAPPGCPAGRAGPGCPGYR